MGRKDGFKIKGIDGFFRMASMLVGKTRPGSTNFLNYDIVTRPLDDFIAEKKKEGIEYTYRDIVLATLVRVFYLIPRLNRFVVSGNFYQRYFIDIAIAVQKNLRTAEQETTINLRFTGKETLAEIKAELDEKIKLAMTGKNGTDDFTGGALGKSPTWLLRIAMKWLYFADRHGLLSEKFLRDQSPFHSSIFFGDMKSIHIDTGILHHLYDFGTCGFHANISKEIYKNVVDQRTLEPKVEKVIEFAGAEDERFVDGYTWSMAMKKMKRIMENLSVLEQAPSDDEIRYPYMTEKQKKSFFKQMEKVKKMHEKFIANRI